MNDARLSYDRARVYLHESEAKSMSVSEFSLHVPSNLEDIVQVVVLQQIANTTVLFSS